MALRNLLVCIDPTSAGDARLKLAFNLARANKAHLSGAYILKDGETAPHGPSGFAGIPGMTNLPDEPSPGGVSEVFHDAEVADRVDLTIMGQRPTLAGRSKPGSIQKSPRRRRTAMARAFQFDVGPVVEQLNRILQMELAAVIYYTHYSFMIYGHARIPITSWLRDNATESLAHAQEAGEMIMRLHKRPALGIAALPTTPHNTIDEILTESIQREEAGVELYRELLALVKDKSVVLEEYATRLVSAEAVHLREMELMLMKRAPD